jgi:hypothetical protein
MPYEDAYKRPESHYVVTVQVKEVTPAHTTGTGTQKERHEREVEDAFTVAVKEQSWDDALQGAIDHLTTAKERS